MITLVKKLASSVKAKLIFSFVLVVFIMAAISISSFTIVSFSQIELNEMIETIVVVNRITENATKIKDMLTSTSITDKLEEKKEASKKGLDEIENMFSLLDDLVEDSEGINNLVSINNFAQSFGETANGVLEAGYKEQYDIGDEKKDALRKQNDFLKNSINSFISNELIAQQEKREAIRRTTEVTGFIILISIFIVSVISILFTVMFSNKVGNTISKVTKAARKISEGDLSVDKINVKSVDEIYFLAQYFNKMVDTLRQVILKISQASNEVSNSADLLKVSTEQNTYAIEQVASSIQQVANGAEEQSQLSSNTVNTISDLFEMNKNILNNLELVLNSSTKANESALRGDNDMDILTKQIKVIEKKIVTTQSVTEVLKEKSKEIEKILSTTSNIAEQTNLLALNAAIEAARAGESGKGFAVVAEEVKKLAEASANATGLISKILKEISSKAEEVAADMIDGVKEVKEGTNLTSKTSLNFEGILSNSKDVDIKIKDIKSDIEKMIDEFTKVRDMSISIEDVAKQSLSGSHGVAASVQQQTANQEEIASSANILSKMADDLKVIVAQFQT